MQENIDPSGEKQATEYGVAPVPVSETSIPPGDVPGDISFSGISMSSRLSQLGSEREINQSLAEMKDKISDLETAVSSREHVTKQVKHCLLGS